MMLQQRHVRAITNFAGRVRMNRLAQSHRTFAARCLAVNAFQTLTTLPIGAIVIPVESIAFDEDDDGT